MDQRQKLVQEGKFPLWKRQFVLFLDDTGLWRCRGRLGHASVLYETKHPLLPRNHLITTLIIQEAHGRVQHNGVKDTLTEVRTNIWVVKARRFEESAYHDPPSPIMPTFRVGRATLYIRTREWTLQVRCILLPLDPRWTRHGYVFSHATSSKHFT